MDEGTRRENGCTRRINNGRMTHESLFFLTKLVSADERNAFIVTFPYNYAAITYVSVGNTMRINWQITYSKL